jgi:putative sterol carrier protein
VVAIGESFTKAFHLIESLEEAVRIAGVARLFQKEDLNVFEQELKQELSKPLSTSAHEMFSPAHIQAIVELVNNDEFIAQKGAELDLTVELALKLQEEQDTAYRLRFEKGRISRVEHDDKAPFVISAPAKVWRQVFLGRLDPFVATTQGKMKLKGQLGKLSRWYVPFSRLFELFKLVEIQ